MRTNSPSSPPLERRKVAEQIADALKHAIVGGQFKPGQALPSERELANQYEVNRSSIREALLRLEAWGLIKIKQGGATRVRDFLLSAGLEMLPHLFDVGGDVLPDVLRDVHEIRAMLLGWCAEQAAQKADASSVARLEMLVQQMSEPRVKAADAQELDYAFFEELVRISGNRLLTLLANVIRDLYMRGRDHFLPMYAKGVFSAEHHHDAVAAIRARNPVAAAAAMRAHAQSALKTVGAR